jgi:hypothetical protein
MKKSYLSTILVIVFLVAALAVIGFIFRFLGNESTSTEENSIKIVEQDSCESFTNQALVFDNGDVDNCECLENEIQIAKCQADLGNRDLYDQALVETNIEICENINTADMKNSCLKIVQSKIDYIENRDNL